MSLCVFVHVRCSSVSNWFHSWSGSRHLKERGQQGGPCLRVENWKRRGGVEERCEKDTGN